MRVESHVGRAATGGELSSRGKTVEREHRLADGWEPIDALDPDDEPFLRAENEDDDGYDPFSDRPAAPEPLFERDPWK